MTEPGERPNVEDPVETREVYGTGLGDVTPGQPGSEGGGETLQPMQQFMTEMFQLVSRMTEQQQRTAAEERAVERARQEEERKRLAEVNATNMQRMMEQLVEAVKPTPRTDERREESGRRSLETKIARLSEVDDIEAYLTTFERLMSVERVDRATWAVRLAPHLTGKAQQAYAAMRETDSADYTKVKEAILRRYNISQETYRQRFRSVRRKEGESYGEVVVRLEDLLHKWMKGCGCVEDVLERVLVEQLLSTMPGDLRVWVSERKPTTGSDVGKLADDYLQARQQTSKEGSEREKTSPRKQCHQCGSTGHLVRNCPQRDTSKDNDGKHQEKKGPDGRNEGNKRSKIICFNCKQRGHISYNCPDKAGLCSLSGKGKRTTRSGFVEGVEVTDILLDTGCTQTMVRRDLVSQDQLIEGEAATIRCVHGDTVLYPLADVIIKVEGHDLTVRAAVSETLPMSVLLGTDVPQLGQLLHSNPALIHSHGVEHALVTTRSQARKHEEDQRRGATARTTQLEGHRDAEGTAVVEGREVEDGDGGKDSVVDVEVKGSRGLDVEVKGSRGLDVEVKGSRGLDVEGVAEKEGESEGGGWDIGDSFDDDLFMQPTQRQHLTRREKRVKKKEYGLIRALDSRKKRPPVEGLAVTPQELQQLQESDCSLAHVSDFPGYFRRDGIMYRQWVPRGQQKQDAIEQIILPKECRRAVLQLAHTIPLGGHLGKKKTSAKIMKRFYWPTLYRDVEDFCRSCAKCQKAGHRRVRRAPLVPLPIIAEPFERIAMDVVGPLPRSRAGHRYVLVVCDYATRYPEAVAMRSVDAENVAEELVRIFSRVGIPKEILTDQGTNFTSELLAEMYRLLHINGLRTSPYHPQTDGMVERFNGTLKEMLRKCAIEDGKDWDRLLPYVLFAYREAPHESTGFSPFELLYGREIRGPLDVLKEEWEAKSRNESVVSHIMLMRERLESMASIVQENMKRAQAQQKQWYDRTARERVLEEGEKVLVLLPTSTSKLLAQWQGPYVILKRVGKVNYVVDMADRRKRRRTFHVNMLRKWNEPVSTSYFAEGGLEREEDEVLTWDGGAEGEYTVGGELSPEQREELEAVLRKHQDTLTKVPGLTNLTSHVIETGDASPIRMQPYRVPHAYRDPVKHEIKEMLEQGIIEPSNSEWAAPMVIVKKKDGMIRLCVDYRRLNTVTRVDAYPMPRIDDLIDLVGQAHYISTLDLTKGYWQIPVVERDQPKTAFTTPFGLYQFKRMPFGLMGAPATFQRVMDQILDGLQDFTSAYLDDLIVFSTTWEDHLNHVDLVLNQLRGAGLTAKPGKCQFGMKRCSYLGHVVGGGEVRMEQDKIEAVKRMQPPETKKDVRTFLGLSGYYRRFIPNYASIAAPLTDLTRKSQPNRVSWTPDAYAAFRQLKSSLCAAPVLLTPDFSKRFIVQTDASDRGVGAVLSQQSEEGGDKPVAYFSRKLLPREEKYSTIEKECLAIRLAIHAFRVYLMGRPFTIQTDHRSLEWLNRMKENNARLTRWSLLMQPYEYTVEHRPGVKNSNADTLSRLAYMDAT